MPMATSYHTNANDPDDLRAGVPSGGEPFYEPRAEAPPTKLHARPHFLSQTGTMAQVRAEVDEPLNDVERTRATTEMVAVRTQEFDMSTLDPVLIVEDTVELAEIIEATIEGMGMPTIVANHGSIALDHLQTVSPRLLLLDLSLPDISGWEILKVVKETYKATGRKLPPIIVITAHDDPANRLVGKFQEVNAYLIKPLTLEQIEKTISKVLNAQT